MKKGTRITVTVEMPRCICKVGDRGTIVGLFYAVPNVPRAWEIQLDNGRLLYMYEDEFVSDELVKIA